MNFKNTTKSLAKRFIESAGILFSLLLVFVAIAYAAGFTAWDSGRAPQTVPGLGNVELASGSGGSGEWPSGDYCIMANGTCPDGFTADTMKGVWGSHRHDQCGGEAGAGSSTCKVIPDGPDRVQTMELNFCCKGGSAPAIVKVYTQDITPSGRYLGTNDDFRALDGYGSHVITVDRICQLAGKSEALLPLNYACASGPRNTESRHNGAWGNINATGQGWCQDYGVEWVECIQ